MRCVVMSVSTRIHKSKPGAREYSLQEKTPKQCLNDTGRAVCTPTFPDQQCPGDEAYSVRMQQEHSEKYSVLEQGESWADRQALTSLTAQSLSRLLIPPDTNSRLCFTFTSICRGRREGEREAAETLSHIRFLTFSICLSPTNFLSHGPSSVSAFPLHTLSHFFCHFLTLSPPFPFSLLSLPVILYWGSAETSSPRQPYSLSTLHLKFICKHGPV